MQVDRGSVFVHIKSKEHGHIYFYMLIGSKRFALGMCSKLGWRLYKIYISESKTGTEGFLVDQDGILKECSIPVTFHDPFHMMVDI